MLAGLQGPVAALGDAAAANAEGVSGLQLEHAPVDGVAGGLGEGQQLGYALGVDGGADLGVGQDGLGLGAEQHAVPGGPVVERLDPHPVADQQQFLGARVPECEGVHAVEPGGEVLAPLEVGVEGHLGVAAGPEGVPVGLQLGAQLAVVVDLTAVGGDQQGAAVVLDGHGLGAAGYVDHRQSAVAEGHMRVQPQAGCIGAPAGHGLGHRGERAALTAEVSVVGDPSGDSAHEGGFLSGSSVPQKRDAAQAASRAAEPSCAR